MNEIEKMRRINELLFSLGEDESLKRLEGLVAAPCPPLKEIQSSLKRARPSKSGRKLKPKKESPVLYVLEDCGCCITEIPNPNYKKPKRTMNTLPSASDAAATVRDIESDRNKKQLDLVTRAIIKAIDKGSFRAYFYETLHAPVKSDLERKGYGVSSYSDPRDGVTVTISW